MLAALGILLTAVAIEVAATASLPRTEGFRNPLWTCLVLVGYAASIGLLAVVVEKLPVSTAYAVWAGLGTATVAVIGVVWLGESWNATKAVALLMIVTGVIVLNLEGVH